MASYYIKFEHCSYIYNLSEFSYTYTQVSPSMITINFDVDSQKDVDYMANQIRKLKDTIMDYDEANTTFIYRHNGKVCSSVITHITGFSTDFSDYLEDEDDEEE